MKLTWLVLLLSAFHIRNNVAIRFTNIKCQTFHPEFATFEECHLKVIRRGVIGLNVYVKLWQLPVNNISINLAFLKKANGYRPFLYNVTTNFCGFWANRKKYPIVDVFIGVVTKDSNINHTCPYNHDIIVKNLVLDMNKLRYIPFPRGEYRIDLKVAAYNDWKADVKAYIEILEDL
ncbi:uncharacterized protein LOC133331657 [Musca vetustissima]|uniref:uncharacterized protein LOC133331657 n=1 Tax=Musca vetustissima TaxID=27455 RepID=UPI002AB6D3B0|nr:uncharacterized protein LOC133331657 [Musca vetustissima]